MEWLKGKKTYITAIVGIILNGLIAMGYISSDLIVPINSVLGFLGLGTLRAGVKKTNE